MANPTKKIEAHSIPNATVRVYMDLSTEVNQALEVRAKSQGRTKKGHLEFLVRQDMEEFQAKEAETNKREEQAKKGKRK